MQEQDRAEELTHQQIAAMKASLDGMAILDQEGKYTYLNEAHAQIYGYKSHKELVGKTWKILYSPSELKRFENDIMPAFWKAGRWRGEAMGLRQDGTLFPQEVSLTAIEGGGLVCFVRDITELKRVEAERERALNLEKEARAEAEALSRSKDEFLALISHELRTPLTAMLGWTLLLREGTISQSERDRALEIITRNMRMQAQIVEDMFDVSSIVTGKLRLNTEDMELAPLLRSALDNIGPEAKAKNIRLDQNIDADGVRILGDHHRLQQVLWNLLSNAIKFTPSGGCVRVGLARVAAGIAITVADSGNGIAADFLPFVFDRFRQEEHALKRTHRGLGLGLAIVRHITELHGGAVKAESEGAGKGATFTVTLPVKKPS